MDKDTFTKMLKEILEDQIKKMAEDDASQLARTVNSAAQRYVTQLQESLAGVPEPVSSSNSDDIVRRALPFHQINQNMLVTRQGSILDLTKKHAPWVQCSEVVEKWALAFSEYLNSRGARVAKVLQEQEDPSGGYLVPEEFRATMLMYDAEPAVIWPRATIWPMTSDKLGMPKLAQRPDGIANDNYDHFAGVSFTWTEEGGSKTETEPTFEFIELIAHELSGYTQITNILLDDSAINIMNFLTNLFRAGWIWQTDKSFIRDNGANKPLGVTMDPSVLTVNRATLNTVTYADVMDMWEKLPSVFEAGAVWMMNKQVLAKLREELASSGDLKLQQTYASYAEGMNAYLFGIPIVLADGKTQPLGTKGDVILGNFRHYYIGDRQRFTMDSSAHYLFRSNKTAVRVSGRLDGQPAMPEAFVVLDTTASGS